ncbi:hypothetical protein [Aureimonas psammosilenae]|uniref:hypothetical protein n=1 Tax=Aureimonas psammosilenae TaxID=2495496 RepID=UPI00126109B8|nr:hypothetical protein [Aureimonas psammosilenae]
MSKLKLIGLGFAALSTIGAGVVGSLGYKKLKMQDEAIDRMVSTLEDANDMLIRYEDKVKEQAEKIEALKAENKRLRNILNEKEVALETYEQMEKDVIVDETTGKVSFEENKEFEEMRKQGKGKPVPFNVFANPINEGGTYTKKLDDEPEEVHNYSEFIHTNQDVTNVWDQNPSYDTEQGDLSVEIVEEEARRIEVSNNIMKQEIDKNGQEVLFSYFDMITFPYRNDAEFGLARAMQFANHYGIPFNDGNNEQHSKFNFNRFVGKLKSLFDYNLDLEQVCDNDSAVIDDLLAVRKQYFGPDSVHSQPDQITLGEWIDYAIKRVGYDMYNFNWAVMMDYVMNSIGWYTDNLSEADRLNIVDLIQNHSYHNDYYDSYGLFRLIKGIDQYWGEEDAKYSLQYSLRNEWNSFLSRVLDYEAEHEDD